MLLLLKRPLLFMLVLTLSLCFMLPSLTRLKVTGVERINPNISFHQAERPPIAPNPNISFHQAERPPIAPQFHLLTLAVSARSQHRYKAFSPDEQDKRSEEYMRVLQSNLNHDNVAKIHLFHLLDEDMEMIMAANLTNSQKIQPVKWRRLLNMVDFFLYASKNLINESVIALNGDIALGEGFELVNTSILLKDRHMYSLTRHEIDVNCSMGYQMCSDRYRGSHDTHMFALAKPLEEKLLIKKLNYPINMYQAENGMIYTMKYYFGFKVLNPCMTLKTYHHHCSVVHGPPEKNHYSILRHGWTQKKVQQGKANPCSL